MSALSPHVCRQAGTGQISSLPSLRLLPRGFQCSWMSPVWPVLGLLTRPTARSPECNGYSGMTLHHHWRKRLSDPKDVRAGCAFAAALLGLEALVCVAIITRVPCGDSQSLQPSRLCDVFCTMPPRPVAPCTLVNSGLPRMPCRYGDRLAGVHATESDIQPGEIAAGQV